MPRPGGRDSLEAVHNFLALERQPRLPLAAIDKDLVLAARGNLGFVWALAKAKDRLQAIPNKRFFSAFAPSKIEKKPILEEESPGRDETR